MYRDNLPSNQAQLAVLGQILEEYRHKKQVNDLPIPSIPFKSNGLDVESLFRMQKVIRQRDALESLKQKELIEVLSLDDSFAGIRITILDLSALTKLYRELFESIPLEGNLTRIIYSPRSGEGRIDGMRFKLNRRSVNRKIFDKLVKSAGLQLTRTELWKLTSHSRIPLKNKGSTSDFSSTISNLRAALNQISPNILVLEDSHIKIIADLSLTDKSH